jgi:Kelch motif/Galactose oxidase, central domain
LNPGPSPRWGHVAVLDSARRDAVVFGGFSAGNEVWIFSFANRSWTRVDAPNGPSSRESPAAVSDPAGDRMVLVGGFLTSAPTDEVWAFSFTNHAWSPLPKGPSPRFDMGAATDGVHAWFYGGFLTGFQATDELWQFDFASNTWSLLPQSQVRPSPRTNMGIAVNAGSLYIVGGHDATGLTPGTWRYDFSSNTWSELSPDGVPGAGAHFASATDDCLGVLLLAGGDHDDNIDVNTTDIFDFAQPSFSRLPAASNFAPVRRHSALVLEPESQTLMLFGGLQDPSPILGDTWLYQLERCPK